jgi:hypothetical protein
MNIKQRQDKAHKLEKEIQRLNNTILKKQAQLQEVTDDGGYYCKRCGNYQSKSIWGPSEYNGLCFECYDSDLINNNMNFIKEFCLTIKTIEPQFDDEYGIVSAFILIDTNGVKHYLYPDNNQFELNNGLI